MWNESGYGGGYLQSPGKTDSPQRSQAGRSKDNQSSNILPCSIAQLLAVPEPDDHVTVSFEDSPSTYTFKNISIVGRVNYVEEVTTNITYSVEDYSGPEFKLRRWKENTEEETNENAIEEGQYVKAVGKLSGIQGKKHMQAFYIVPLKSFNQLTTHMLEVVHSRMSLRSYQKAAANTDMGNRSMEMDTNMGMIGFHGNNMDNVNGLTMVQKAVHDVIVAAPNEDGYSLDHVLQTVKGASKDAIKKAVEFLVDEGHIYPTIDDVHFKAT